MFSSYKSIKTIHEIKMPKKLNWIFLDKFKTENCYNSFLDTIPPYSTTNSNLVTCNICKDGKNHKMRQKYLLCKSKFCGKSCTVKYKVEHCKKKNLFKIYKTNKHMFEHVDVKIEEKKFGLSKLTKSIIENIINQHDVHTTQRILIKLKSMKRKGDIENIPDKAQLTSYLSRRRKSLGSMTKTKSSEDNFNEEVIKIDENNYKIIETKVINVYMVDLLKKKCSCMQNYNHGSCKHLAVCGSLVDNPPIDELMKSKF